MILLLGNIFAYSLSEDYRFFLKKLKYSQDVVYDDVQVDDSQRVVVVSSWVLEDQAEDTGVIIWQEGITFIDALEGKKILQEPEVLPELTGEEIDFIEAFKKRFVISQVDIPVTLFDITTEYPDKYYEYSNKHIAIYVFPTKTYSEVKKIFEVLEFELPYSINEVNNFWTSSFYINLDDWYSDEIVRIVLEHEKRAFWLKIKKDSYNILKEIVTNFSK